MNLPKNGKWIIIPRMLPTQIRPPKLSILWSWPTRSDKYKERAALQKEQYKGWYREEHKELKTTDFYFEDGSPFGMTPNYTGTREFWYESELITIFPNEFNFIDAKKLHLWIIGGEDGFPSHDLIHYDDNQIYKIMSNPDTRAIYEAALVDGATPEVAKLVVLGFDVDEDFELLPIGWYQLKPEYTDYF